MSGVDLPFRRDFGGAAPFWSFGIEQALHAGRGKRSGEGGRFLQNHTTWSDTMLLGRVGIIFPIPSRGVGKTAPAAAAAAAAGL